MNNLEYNGPEQFRPLSAWGYVGYGILFTLPLVGLVLIIVFSLNNDNINRRNYARSILCWMLIAVILFVVLAATGVLASIGNRGFGLWKL